MSDAAVLLENGLFLRGYSGSKPQTKIADLAFNTQIVGHQEILTNPVYKDLILSFSMSQIGNVGARKAAYESKGAQVSGLLVKDLSPLPSHWQSEQSFTDFLNSEDIFYISDLDTRAIALALGEHGNMRAIMSNEILDPEALKKRLFEAEAPLVEAASANDDFSALTSGDTRVACFNLETPKSFLESFEAEGITLIPVADDASPEEVLALNPQAFFIQPSSSLLKPREGHVELISSLLEKLPIFGIQYGMLVLGQALGFELSEPKTASYASNIPVKHLNEDKVEVIVKAQRYGLKDDEKLQSFVTHRNMHDGRIEGIENGTAFAVSFFPVSSIFEHKRHPLMERFITSLK